MKKYLFSAVTLFLCLSCVEDQKIEAITSSEGTKAFSEIENDSTFNPEKWKTKEGSDYPYRNMMLSDVMSNENIRNLKRPQVLQLLGEPDRIDSNYLFYRIKQTRLGAWPIHTKTMVVKFTRDSLIEWIKIHE